MQEAARGWIYELIWTLLQGACWREKGMKKAEAVRRIFINKLMIRR
jgi:hypothetical protein